MSSDSTQALSYFPGCSMATSARESHLSLMKVARRLGLELQELEDWNCCGSSSAHSLDKDLAFYLAARNLSLAPPEKPLLVMCPSCLHRLQLAQVRMQEDSAQHQAAMEACGRDIDLELSIVHFFEILEQALQNRGKGIAGPGLRGIRFLPYYGCMLAYPPVLRRKKKYHGIIESILSSVDAEAVSWPFASRCCGTFLAAARPDIATKTVNHIMYGAVRSGAECLVTACAMCQLNLEIRCTIEHNLPVFHLSEILAIAMGETAFKAWFKRHLVDPIPLMKGRGFIH